MKTLKASCLATGLLLLAMGSARAQQITTDTTTGVTIHRVIITQPPANPLLTAADSARERARLANIQRLRHEATAPPAKVATAVPLSPMTGEAAPTAAPAPPTAEEVARVRAQQEKAMIARALTKKGQQGSKATSKQIKQEKRLGTRE